MQVTRIRLHLQQKFDSCFILLFRIRKERKCWSTLHVVYHITFFDPRTEKKNLVYLYIWYNTWWRLVNHYDVTISSWKTIFSLWPALKALLIYHFHHNITFTSQKYEDPHQHSPHLWPSVLRDLHVNATTPELLRHRIRYSSHQRLHKQLLPASCHLVCIRTQWSWWTCASGAWWFQLESEDQFLGYQRPFQMYNEMGPNKKELWGL